MKTIFIIIILYNSIKFDGNASDFTRSGSESCRSSREMFHTPLSIDH